MKRLLVLVGVLLAVAGPASAQTSGWEPTAAPTEPRVRATAVTLADGRVLVVGGRGAEDPFVPDPERTESADVYDPATGVWSAVPFPANRGQSTATRIDDGRVLVFGQAGYAYDRERPSSIAVFDPTTSSWAAPVSDAAIAFDAVGGEFLLAPLPRSRALAIGSDTGQPHAFIIDVAAGTIADAPMPTTFRSGATLTALADGRLLLVGGDDGRTSVAAVEMFDPETGAWSDLRSLAAARSYHAAALVADGRVLVVGGWGPDGPVASAELYDPVTDGWTTVASPARFREEPTLSALADGRAVLVGGVVPSGTNPDDRSAATTLATGAEIYDAPSDSWTPAAGPSARLAHVAAAMPDGSLLVALGLGDGGLVTTAERFTAPGAPPPTTPASADDQRVTTKEHARDAADSSGGRGIAIVVGLSALTVAALVGATRLRRRQRV
ncbi:MAG: Kelch repeat-containing protein [Actinomycetota bacterium]